MSGDRLKDFFNVPTAQSLKKIRLVAKYFDAYTNVMMGRIPREPINYVDLYCGPGKYRNGVPSVPLRILACACTKPGLADRIRAVFNDKDPTMVCELEENIRKAGFPPFRHAPQFHHEDVEQSGLDLIDRVSGPGLLFLDPFGYRGLSLNLIRKWMAHRFRDCIFFLNYTRVNPAIDNEFFADHIDAIFGPDRARSIRERSKGMKAEARIDLVIKEMCSALREIGAVAPLPFRFYSQEHSRLSHCLFLAGGHKKAAEIMKELMAKEGTLRGGIRTFEHDPSVIPSQQELFQSGIEHLALQIGERFDGQTVTLAQVVKVFAEPSSEYRPADVRKAIDHALHNDMAYVEDGSRSLRPGALIHIAKREED